MITRLTLLLLILPSLLLAKDYGTAKVTEVVNVYDGDTFRVNLEGYKPLVTVHS
jgi:hypothetical protein